MKLISNLRKLNANFTHVSACSSNNRMMLKYRATCCRRCRRRCHCRWWRRWRRRRWRRWCALQQQRYRH